MMDTSIISLLFLDIKIQERYAILLDELKWNDEAFPLHLKAKVLTLDNQIKKKIILEIFKKDVEARNLVLLKGNALNLKYGEFKGSSDIDILVLNESKEICLGKDYKKIDSKKYGLTISHQSSYENVKYKRQNIDLHYNLTHPNYFPIDKKIIKENLRYIEVDGLILQILEPEIQILNLVIQMIMDGNVKHYSVIDIWVILNNEKINVERLKELLSIHYLFKFVEMFIPFLADVYDVRTRTPRKHDQLIKVLCTLLFVKQPKNYGLRHTLKKIILTKLFNKNFSIRSLIFKVLEIKIAQLKG